MAAKGRPSQLTLAHASPLEKVNLSYSTEPLTDGRVGVAQSHV